MTRRSRRLRFCLNRSVGSTLKERRGRLSSASDLVREDRIRSREVALKMGVGLYRGNVLEIFLGKGFCNKVRQSNA